MCPERKGYGTELLNLLSNKAEREGYDCVMGFCTADLTAFHLSCGWFVYDNDYFYLSGEHKERESRIMVSSKPILDFKDLIIWDTW